VNEIFTSAYRDNLRSIHTLTRLGFQAMALRGAGEEVGGDAAGDHSRGHQADRQRTGRQFPLVSMRY